MTRFRPCIDLHQGQVKQIVGGTLTDDASGLRTNFISDQTPEHYASMYRDDGLEGGHIILLGPGNDDAARRALASYPGGLQVGGGIQAGNAAAYLDAGASHVIVTSWLFDQNRFSENRLCQLEAAVGRERLVLDLSCRRTATGWTVAKDRWQTLTDLEITSETIRRLSAFCAEFLIHAADVEGLCQGIDTELVERLGQWCEIPVTYAGGARSLSDLERVNELSHGSVDLAIGSALDIFGGDLIRYADCVSFNHRH